MDSPGDPDILRVWTLLSEVSEQLSHNRSTAVNVHSLSDGSKAQAIHSQTGFVLRRFNTDKPKEVYDAELERMNNAMSAENLALLNDNRQLSALIREYEQTLENVMATFRTRAHEVQQRELALMRHYERILIQHETEAVEESLRVSNARSESLARAGRMLRAVMRRMHGEDVAAYEAYVAHQNAIANEKRREASAASAGVRSRQTSADEHAVDVGEGRVEEAEAERAEEAEKGEDVELDLDRVLEEEDDLEKRLAAADWALEREIELARLEREHEELIALANGLLQPLPTQTPEPAAPAAPAPAPVPVPASAPPQEPDHPTIEAVAGGPRGSVGPFGTYKQSPGARIG
ncbi:uncharacterized protein BXZ73DRAFT_101226 [Epithele typhae]|uniref:uncharacterized protein n=1 Tax=Epithele typhae TaxID=378194 RepID=UPI002008577D|nr:uncharacterized protein BXZ73DRAFT_101226 [Epithele typhae]KAH9932684.1 hypothetical protein BXZ73DRAFT_101226 [Epithele typhae]